MIVFLLNLLGIFWLIRTIKFVLFWIYLWQLKEYHIGRFADHFRTHKGKKLLFNQLFFIKVLLLILLVSSYTPYLSFLALLLVYGMESSAAISHFVKRSLRLPKFTFKTALLVLASLLVVVLSWLLAYGSSSIVGFMFYLLVFDMLTLVTVSIIVLMFQPLFVLARYRILAKAKSRIRTFPNLTVIGVTGSYGKTSTKEFLTAMLSSKFNVLSTPDHKNSEMGIAQTILKDLKPNHQIFIVEMGAYGKGGIKLLCNMVGPKIGIVTGVNEQHLSTFGSLDNLLSAEGGRELAQCLPKEGIMVLNGDNKHCLDLYKKFSGNKKVYTVKRDTIDSDIWAEDVVVEKDHISFLIKNRQKDSAHVMVAVLGGQNVQNILGAALIAGELGMSLKEISQACRDIKQEQVGITLKKGVHDINIIDSSYSSNPDGALADLDYLSIFKDKKVVVMPCLIELGAASARIHYNIGKKIAQVCDLAIITTKERFEDLKNGAVQNGMPEDKILLHEKPNDIFTAITHFCKEGDAVLLEGGRPRKLIGLLISGSSKKKAGLQ